MKHHLITLVFVLSCGDSEPTEKAAPEGPRRGIQNAGPSADTQEGKEANLRKGLDRAEKLLNRASHDPGLGASLTNILEQGGSVVTFLNSNGPGGGGIGAPLTPNQPLGPWTIVVRQEGGETVLDAYGEDLERPFESRRVPLRPAGM